MKDLYKRFKININIKEAQDKFKNKIDNILFYSLAFNNENENDFHINDLTWDFCNNLHLEYGGNSSFKARFQNLSFSRWFSISDLNCPEHLI